MVDQNKRAPRYGQNVWRRGRGRKTEEKKRRARHQRMNISTDHLVLCTLGLIGFSVESWMLKPAHIPPETMVSAALRFASKG